MNLYDEMRGVLATLDGARVDYALVGGLAVAVWGAPRATKDIDLLIRAEDLARGMAAVRSCGFTLEALPFEFKDGTTLQRVNKIDAAKDLLTLDFMIVGAHLESAWEGRVRMPMADGHVWVVSREALIGMKALAARPQDLMDIQNLKDLDR